MSNSPLFPQQSWTSYVSIDTDKEEEEPEEEEICPTGDLIDFGDTTTTAGEEEEDEARTDPDIYSSSSDDTLEYERQKHLSDVRSPGAFRVRRTNLPDSSSTSSSSSLASAVPASKHPEKEPEMQRTLAVIEDSLAHAENLLSNLTTFNNNNNDKTTLPNCEAGEDRLEDLAQRQRRISRQLEKLHQARIDPNDVAEKQVPGTCVMPENDIFLLPAFPRICVLYILR